MRVCPMRPLRCSTPADDDTPATSGSTITLAWPSVCQFCPVARKLSVISPRPPPPPRFAGAHLVLGNALSSQGKLDQAIAEYRAPSAIGPTCRGPLQPRRRPLAQGKLDEAIAEYRRAIRSSPIRSGHTSTSGIALCVPG